MVGRRRSMAVGNDMRAIRRDAEGERRRCQGVWEEGQRGSERRSSASMGRAGGETWWEGKGSKKSSRAKFDRGRAEGGKGVGPRVRGCRYSELGVGGGSSGRAEEAEHADVTSGSRRAKDVEYELWERGQLISRVDGRKMNTMRVEGRRSVRLEVRP